MKKNLFKFFTIFMAITVGCLYFQGCSQDISEQCEENKTSDEQIEKNFYDDYSPYLSGISSRVDI